MKFQYTITPEPHIDYLMYSALKNPRLKRRTLFTRFGLAIIYVVLGFLLSREEVSAVGAGFVIIGVAIGVFYPKYQLWRYRKHYTRHVNEKLADMLGTTVTIDLQDEEVVTKDASAESKFSYSSIQEVEEVEKYFYLRLNSAQALVLPKSVVSDEQQLFQFLADKGVSVRRK
ncbi:MAG: YcxB family protein [Flavobacteriia bacterium]|nr:YcxB family protein [Flavobacteriia bacterium]